MKRISLNEGSFAFVLAQTALLNCAVAGLQAENQSRANNGMPIFDEAEFDALKKQFEPLIGYEAIMEMAK